MKHAHAKDRLIERFNVVLSKQQARKMVEDIEEGRATYLGKGNLPERSIYKVKIPGTEEYCRVVYHAYRKYIVTCIPLKDE